MQQITVGQILTYTTLPQVTAVAFPRVPPASTGPQTVSTGFVTYVSKSVPGRISIDPADHLGYYGGAKELLAQRQSAKINRNVFSMSKNWER